MPGKAMSWGDLDRRGKRKIFLALPPLAGTRLERNKNVQTKVREVAIAKAAAIEHLDFQVHTFGEAVAMPTIEVVQDAFAPIVERVDECL